MNPFKANAIAGNCVLKFYHSLYASTDHRLSTWRPADTGNDLTRFLKTYPPVSNAQSVVNELVSCWLLKDLDLNYLFQLLRRIADGVSNSTLASFIDVHFEQLLTLSDGKIRKLIQRTDFLMKEFIPGVTVDQHWASEAIVQAFKSERKLSKDFVDSMFSLLLRSNELPVEKRCSLLAGLAASNPRAELAKRLITSYLKGNDQGLVVIKSFLENKTWFDCMRFQRDFQSVMKKPGCLWLDDYPAERWSTLESLVGTAIPPRLAGWAVEKLAPFAVYKSLRDVRGEEWGQELLPATSEGRGTPELCVLLEEPVVASGSDSVASSQRRASFSSTSCSSEDEFSQPTPVKKVNALNAGAKPYVPSAFFRPVGAVAPSPNVSEPMIFVRWQDGLRTSAERMYKYLSTGSAEPTQSAGKYGVFQV